MQKKRTLTYISYFIFKINSKQVVDLSIKHETIKVLEENIGNILNFRVGKEFLDMTPKSRSIKDLYVGLNQNLNFFSAKDTINNLRKQATDQEKLFANQISDKGLYPEYIKNSQKSAKKKTNIILKWSEN